MDFFGRVRRFAVAAMLMSGWVRAAPVTQADLEAALANARTAWKADLDVSVRFEERNSCETARVGQPLQPGRPAIASTRRVENKAAPANSTTSN